MPAEAFNPLPSPPPGRGRGLFSRFSPLLALLLACTEPVANQGSGGDALLANNLGETLSWVDLPSLTMTNDARETGGSPNQLLAKDGKIHVVNSLTNSVMVLDGVTLEVIREVSTGPGTNPFSMTFLPSGLAAITCYKANEVVFLDLEAPQPEVCRLAMPAGDDLPHDPLIETSARPSGLAMVGEHLIVALGNLDGNYVAGGAGALAIVSPVTMTLEGTITLQGRNAVSITALDDTRALVSCAGTFGDDGFVGDGVVEEVDVAQGATLSVVAMGEAPYEAVVAPSGRVYVASGSSGVILRFELATAEILPPLDIRGPDDGLGLSFVSCLGLTASGLLLACEFNHDKLVAIDTLDNDALVAEAITGDGPDAIVVFGE